MAERGAGVHHLHLAKVQVRAEGLLRITIMINENQSYYHDVCFPLDASDRMSVTCVERWRDSDTRNDCSDNKASPHIHTLRDFNTDDHTDAAARY